eukprot:scaffold74420_cov57-Phaeocystis_antarctica.AAC.2
MGHPSSKSRPSVGSDERPLRRADGRDSELKIMACPSQWLPVLLATASSSPSPPPSPPLPSPPPLPPPPRTAAAASLHAPPPLPPRPPLPPLPPDTIMVGSLVLLEQALTDAAVTHSPLNVVLVQGGAPQEQPFLLDGRPLLVNGTNVTIRSHGEDATLDASFQSRLFEVVNGGELTLNGVRLQNGHAGLENGGGMLVQGTGSKLRMTGGGIFNCTASHGGGIALESGSEGMLFEVPVAHCTATENWGGALYVAVR